MNNDEFLNMLPDAVRARVEEQQAIQDGDFNNFIEKMNDERQKLTAKMVMSIVTGDSSGALRVMSELLAHFVLVEDRMFDEAKDQRNRIATLESLLVGGTESSE